MYMVYGEMSDYIVNTYGVSRSVANDAISRSLHSATGIGFLTYNGVHRNHCQALIKRTRITPDGSDLPTWHFSIRNLGRDSEPSNSKTANSDSGYWAVSARMHYTNGFGQQASKDIPTFYLHENVQGILTEEQAISVVEQILNPVNIPTISFTATAVKL